MSQFTKVPVLDIPTNNFDLSHNFNFSCDGGLIIPIKCVEALPKDTFKYNNKIFVRLAPMVAPAMTKMDVTCITGFVPLRLLWNNYEKFFGNPVPDENTPVAPYFDSVVANVGSLADYLGVPTRQYKSDDGTIKTQYTALNGISALPFGAYQKFYNDWFRDENLVNGGEETFTPLTDGANNFNNYNVLRRRAWRHDYFTSNLPFAQKGEAVEIPIANFVDVPVALNPNRGNAGGLWRATGADYPPGFDGEVHGENGGITSSPQARATLNGTNNFTYYDPNDGLVAQTSELSDLAAVTVNTLRWAEKLQVFLEKNARGGTRYTEIVRQHFGQRSSDARLQRAEFLGFSVNPIVISEVLQTSPSTEDNTPLAEMAGHGISYGGSKFVTYHAEEHGFFITMLSIRPKTAYMQGLARMWSRKSPLDYAWPTFASLGEQETLNKEIYIQDDDDGNINEQTFGYLPRYAEYRYESDRTSGEFRTTLTHWHQTRIFDSLPALNEDFIQCVPTKRIFAVNLASNDPFWINVNHNLSVRRALPKYGIPAL